MNLRHLRYFVALAREQHHARAAEACHVTQSTLSEAVRQLEAELGVPLIERGGPRFRCLTEAGQRVLVWAQHTLADRDALDQDLAHMKWDLTGRLRLGVVPAAVVATPLLVTPFCRKHPKMTVEVQSMASLEIQRGLDNCELDAGITYLDNEPLHNVRSLALYEECYVLLTAPGGPFAARRSVTWAEAAELPLCLLTKGMQNRRIIDRIIGQAGASLAPPRMETTSMLAICAHVHSGDWASIVPHSLLTVFGEGLRALPLVRPRASQSIGVVAAGRDPLSPVTHAFLAVARSLDLRSALDRPLSSAQVIGTSDRPARNSGLNGGGGAVTLLTTAHSRSSP
ncbi:MAG TPA: LysR family transcriptional regulator [Crenalkalicoccus sp.]|jgi:DNA-binding transcriptional LysR family regulator|nr:LysR family transcriptional regulator [Crenalkalicoccus sp.]